MRCRRRGCVRGADGAGSIEDAKERALVDALTGAAAAPAAGGAARGRVESTIAAPHSALPLIARCSCARRDADVRLAAAEELAKRAGTTRSLPLLRSALGQGARRRSHATRCALALAQHRSGEHRTPTLRLAAVQLIDDDRRDAFKPSSSACRRKRRRRARRARPARCAPRRSQRARRDRAAQTAGQHRSATCSTA